MSQRHRCNLFNATETTLSLSKKKKSSKKKPYQRHSKIYCMFYRVHIHGHGNWNRTEQSVTPCMNTLQNS